jgi:hypothetical protein
MRKKLPVTTTKITKIHSSPRRIRYEIIRDFLLPQSDR